MVSELAAILDRLRKANRLRFACFAAPVPRPVPDNEVDSHFADLIEREASLDSAANIVRHVTDETDDEESDADADADEDEMR